MSWGEVRAKLALSDLLMVAVMLIVGSFVLKGTREPFASWDAIVAGVVFGICVLVLVFDAKTWAKIAAVGSVVVLSYLFFG